MNTTGIKIFIQYIKSILKSQAIFNFSNIAKNVKQWELTRTLSKKIQWQTLLWTFFSSLIVLMGGYLVLDDTILEKPYSKASKVIGSFIRWVYSHKEKKSVRGIQVVFLLFVVGNFRFPIGFRIYDKSKTKNELALELLSYARNKFKLKKQYVLFDSWYSCKKLLKRIKDYGWYFVCRIKRNRKVNNISVKKLITHPYCIMEGFLNNMKIMLVRNRKHFIITNSLSLTKGEILAWYKKRSCIEEFFKVIKSRFKAKSCQSRTVDIWRTHLSLVLFSFCFVELKRIDLSITIYKAKRELKLSDYRSHIERLKRLLQKA